MIGNVEKFLKKRRAEDGALFLAVIDPVDHPSTGAAVKAAVDTYKAGADAIIVGGSIAVQSLLLDKTVKGIKDKCDANVIIFPGNIGTITPYADAIYFMSMVNSRNPYWTFTAHLMAAPVLQKFDVEILPTAYIMAEPGGTAGWVGDCKLIPPNKPQLAAYSALASQYLGSRFIITDVGSAAPAPVPPKMVKAVSSVTKAFYIVAGGIRTEKQVRDIVLSGADAIHIGTAIEKKDRVNRLIRACKKAGKEKI